MLRAFTKNSEIEEEEKKKKKFIYECEEKQMQEDLWIVWNLPGTGAWLYCPVLPQFKELPIGQSRQAHYLQGL